jgi:hypothetical protein
MVEVDLSNGVDPLAEALRETTRRVIQAEPGARLACESVLEVARIANESTLDASGRSLHVKGLAELSHGSRALALPAERVTHHVLEAPDAAAGRGSDRVRRPVPGRRPAQGMYCPPLTSRIWPVT